VQPDIGNENVVRIEFDNRSEGPGDVFQLVVERLADCAIRVVPADGGPKFDAILLAGYPAYQAASDDRDNAALVEVQWVDIGMREPTRRSPAPSLHMSKVRRTGHSSARQVNWSWSNAKLETPCAQAFLYLTSGPVHGWVRCWPDLGHKQHGATRLSPNTHGDSGPGNKREPRAPTRGDAAWECPVRISMLRSRRLLDARFGARQDPTRLTNCAEHILQSHQALIRRTRLYR
jgi:hypothetical protein